MTLGRTEAGLKIKTGDSGLRAVSCGCCGQGPCGGCGTIEALIGENAPSELAINASTSFRLTSGGPPTPPAEGSGSTDACDIVASNCYDDPSFCYFNFGIEVILSAVLFVARGNNGVGECVFYISANLQGVCGASGSCGGVGQIGPISKEVLIGTHNVPVNFDFSFSNPDTGESSSSTSPTSVTVTIS